ncbi:MAG: ribosome biogenesis GTPase YlqF [Xanthomonadales bacterium]|nr:ribosome biogenesis GTPase YlqF [Xanthomonadales bacterium]
MHIQWYPGHMYKAGKQIRELLPKVHMVIELLDARIPYSSENPFLAELRGDKPTIKVFNKSDLADPRIIDLWQSHYEKERNVTTLALTQKQPAEVRKINDLCQQMFPHRVAKKQEVRALIMGIPNVGKSTLINTLAGRPIAKTGNEPAVTKSQQRIALDSGVVLFDTPGMLWPNIENPNSGYRLAVTGNIRDTAIEHADVAMYALKYFQHAYPERLCDRYRLDAEQLPELDELQILDAIGLFRGSLKSKGLVDYDKAGKIVLTDLRNGALGRFSLETPQMMAVELIEVARIREQKLAKKEARKNRFKKK